MLDHMAVRNYICVYLESSKKAARQFERPTQQGSAVAGVQAIRQASQEPAPICGAKCAGCPSAAPSTTSRCAAAAAHRRKARIWGRHAALLPFSRGLPAS